MHANDASDAGEAVNALVSLYKKSPSFDPELFERIRNHVFEYSYFFVMRKKEGVDNALDFTVDEILPRTKRILEVFDPEKGTFSNFLGCYCSSAYKFYKNSRLGGKVKQDIAVRLIGDEDSSGDLVLSDSDAVSGAGLLIDESMAAYGARQETALSALTLPLPWRAATDKVCLLAYLLRYANFIADDVVGNVSAFLGIEREALSRCVDEARASTEKNAQKLTDRIGRRNRYYLGIRMIRQRRMAAGELMGEEDEAKCARYERLRRMHDEKIFKLKMVSEIDIARILGIRYENVRKLIYKAKRKLERMKLTK